MGSVTSGVLSNEDETQSGEGTAACSWRPWSVSEHRTRTLVAGIDSQLGIPRTWVNDLRIRPRAARIEQGLAGSPRLHNAYGTHPRLIVHRRLKEFLLRDVVYHRAGDLRVFSIVQIVLWTKHVA